MSMRHLTGITSKNMKRVSAFVLILSILFCVCTFSCNNSVDDMLEDYNGGFKKGYVKLKEKQDESDEVLQPGDEGFDQTKMLRDEYFLGWDSTLNLYAPETAERFQWYISDPDDSDNTPVNFKPCGSDFIVSEITTRRFSLYAEDSELEDGTTYKLTLNVWKGGKRYWDVCSLVVYQHYYWPN